MTTSTRPLASDRPTSDHTAAPTPHRPAVRPGRQPAHPLVLLLACVVAVAAGFFLPTLAAPVACLVMIVYGAHCAITRRRVTRDALLPVVVALTTALVVIVFFLPFSTH